MFKNSLIVLLAILTLSFNSKASHVVGGEIFYDTVSIDNMGNVTYNIYIDLFKECAGIDFPDPLDFTIFNPDNSVFGTFDMPSPVIDTMPLVYDDPCVTPPDDICVMSARYTMTVVLPFNLDGYTVSYQIGNWSGDYVNFVDPSSTGMTITAHVPGGNEVITPNNSVHFSDFPQLIFCLGETLTIPTNVIELDGDSLAFKLCDPLDNNSGGLNPDPEAAPPYPSIVWEAGYNANFPFNTTSPTTIDVNTGEFSTTPTVIGAFVSRICIEEWRNGVLINTASRTYGYRIVNCESEPPFEISVLGGGEIYEGCGSVTFLIERNDTTGILPLEVVTSGDPENGIDYTQLPDTVFIPSGVQYDTLFVETFYDDLVEGDEFGTISLVLDDPCSDEFDTISTSFTLLDYIPLEIEYVDSINTCDDDGTYELLLVNVENGVQPYSFNWWSGNETFPNNDSVWVNSQLLQPNLNYHFVEIFDACGNSIKSDAIEVYNQCALGAPNVMTVNGDGVNEYFTIFNRDNYNEVDLKVFNRWGELVYENSKYEDDWNGVSKNGTPLTEGVYYYMITPDSEKFQYREQEKSRLIVHGFVHIIR